MSTIEDYSRDEVNLAIIRACAEVFDVAALNPDALVASPDDPEVTVMKLEGWNEGSDAWECSLHDERYLIKRLCDPFLCRRVAVWMYTGRRSMFPWDCEPFPRETLQALKNRVVEILTA